MFNIFSRQIMRLNEKNVASFATSQSPVDKEGLLMKKGEINKGYQRRWFVLKGNLLFYFERRGDKEPIGVIVLEKCSVGLCDGGDPYSFYIAFQGPGTRTYVLCADNEDEMTAWIKAISHAGYDYLRMIVGELRRQVEKIQQEKGSLADPFDEAETQAHTFSAVAATGGEARNDSDRTRPRHQPAVPSLADRLHPVPLAPVPFPKTTQSVKAKSLSPPPATIAGNAAVVGCSSMTAYSSLARHLSEKNQTKSGISRHQPSFVSHTASRSEMSKAAAAANSPDVAASRRSAPRSFEEMHNDFGIPIQGILARQANLRELNKSFAQMNL
eukprot:m.311100 g.311100  ORF g.311100 m.311100 type:complete len:327 (+) comp59796_c0_seq1:77-1057(+)